MVKYADGPTTEVSIEIAAPPEKVWPFLTDVNTPAAFSDEFRKGRWLDDEPALGATFRGWNRRENMEWDVLCHVTDFAPNEVFEWSVGLDQERAARWRYELSAADGGAGSVLRYEAELGPGPSGLTPIIEKLPDKEDRIVARRLEELHRNMEATVAGIKDLAESAP